MVLHLNIKQHLPKDALCQLWLKLVKWCWRRRFLNFVNVFSLFSNYLPLEEDRALYLNKTESSSPKDAMCQVRLKLAQWFCRRFLNLSMYFRYFVIISPLEKSSALHLNKTESPSPKYALCQLCLKFAQFFRRRRFLNFVNEFSLFRNDLPFEKGRAIHLNKLESPSPEDALCQVC